MEVVKTKKLTDQNGTKNWKKNYKKEKNLEIKMKHWVRFISLGIEFIDRSMQCTEQPLIQASLVVWMLHQSNLHCAVLVLFCVLFVQWSVFPFWLIILHFPYHFYRALIKKIINYRSKRYEPYPDFHRPLPNL